MGLFDPAWLKQVRWQKHFNLARCYSLERLRKRRNISHDAFAALVNQSPGATKRMLAHEANKFRKSQPHATKQKTFEAILEGYYMDRNLSAMLTGPDARIQNTGAKWQNMGTTIQNMVTVMQNSSNPTKVRDAAAAAQSIDDLVTYLCQEDGFWEKTPDPQKINESIAEILGYHRPKG